MFIVEALPESVFNSNMKKLHKKHNKKGKVKVGIVSTKKLSPGLFNSYNTFILSSYFILNLTSYMLRICSSWYCPVFLTTNVLSRRVTRQERGPAAPSITSAASARAVRPSSVSSVQWYRSSAYWCDVLLLLLLVVESSIKVAMFSQDSLEIIST